MPFVGFATLLKASSDTRILKSDLWLVLPRGYSGHVTQTNKVMVIAGRSSGVGPPAQSPSE